MFIISQISGYQKSSRVPKRFPGKHQKTAGVRFATDQTPFMTDTTVSDWLYIISDCLMRLRLQRRRLQHSCCYCHVMSSCVAHSPTPSTPPQTDHCLHQRISAGPAATDQHQHSGSDHFHHLQSKSTQSTCLHSNVTDVPTTSKVLKPGLNSKLPKFRYFSSVQTFHRVCPDNWKLYVCAEDRVTKHVQPRRNTTKSCIASSHTNKCTSKCRRW